MEEAVQSPEKIKTKGFIPSSEGSSPIASPEPQRVSGSAYKVEYTIHPCGYLVNVTIKGVTFPSSLNFSCFMLLLFSQQLSKTDISGPTQPTGPLFSSRREIESPDLSESRVSVCYILVVEQKVYFYRNSKISCFSFNVLLFCLPFSGL